VQKAGGEETLGPNNIDPSTRIGRLTYYPAVKNHVGPHDGKRRQRLPGTFPGTFYTAQALQLWRKMMQGRLFVVHDAYLKYVQISRQAFGWFDSILLDESQDLTESQIELLLVQQPHADVFVVGDAVQSLYSWRGARPKQLRKLRPRVHPRAVKDDFQLTQSHRFGPGIARIANHFLYIKGHSPQHVLFHHYTIAGVGPASLRVCEGALSGFYTVVGRSNAGLMCEAFQLLAGDRSTKIGLLGGKSATERFDRFCDQVLELLPNYQTEESFSFKRSSYDSWDDFVQEVDDRELPYKTPLALLDKHAEGGELPELIQTFREHVLERSYEEGECEVLLATACGAKGLEWDNVKVLDDFIRLLTFEEVPEEERLPGSDYAQVMAQGSGVPAAAVPMRFAPKNDWTGDELNSWYVAVTRARLRLSLPPRFWALHKAVWSGAGFAPDPESKNEPQYSPQEIAGINALLAEMRRALPPGGSELDAAEGVIGGSQGSSAPSQGSLASSVMAASPSPQAAALASPAASHAAVHGTPSSAMRSLRFDGSGADNR